MRRRIPGRSRLRAQYSIMHSERIYTRSPEPEVRGRYSTIFGPNTWNWSGSVLLFTRAQIGRSFCAISASSGVCASISARVSPPCRGR